MKSLNFSRAFVLPRTALLILFAVVAFQANIGDSKRAQPTAKTTKAPKDPVDEDYNAPSVKDFKNFTIDDYQIESDADYIAKSDVASKIKHKNRSLMLNLFGNQNAGNQTPRQSWASSFMAKLKAAANLGIDIGGGTNMSQGGSEGGSSNTPAPGAAPNPSGSQPVVVHPPPQATTTMPSMFGDPSSMATTAPSLPQTTFDIGMFSIPTTVAPFGPPYPGDSSKQPQSKAAQSQSAVEIMLQAGLKQLGDKIRARTGILKKICSNPEVKSDLMLCNM